MRFRRCGFEIQGFLQAELEMKGPQGSPQKGPQEGPQKAHRKAHEGPKEGQQKVYRMHTKGEHFGGTCVGLLLAFCWPFVGFPQKAHKRPTVGPHFRGKRCGLSVYLPHTSNRMPTFRKEKCWPSIAFLWAFRGPSTSCKQKRG